MFTPANTVTGKTGWRHAIADKIGWRHVALAAVLIAAAIARIAATYPVFNQTYDETYSVACGMQWLDQGAYRYDPKHPPLGRVAAALPLFLAGVRSSGHVDMEVEGNEILRSGGRYWRNLTLARASLLVFFVLACIGVWMWANWAAGPWAAAVALFIYTNVPPLLAHAGLAMTDIPLAAMLTWALFALCLWLERPTSARSVLLGICAGLAVLSKFTTLLFLPVCAIVIAGAALARGGIKPWYLLRIRGIAVALFLAAIVIWAGYRFSFHSLAAERSAAAGDPALAAGLPWPYEVPVPAPQFFEGVLALYHHNQSPEVNYFRHHVSNRGWLWFYPIVAFVKTPLPLLLLAGLGLIAVWREGWRMTAIVACIPAMFLVGMLSHANEGIRHLLTVYSMLAVMSSGAIVRLWRRGLVLKGAAIALLVWLAVDSARAHPDYLAYFNELVDGSSGEFGVSSDLDYGQDLARLAGESRKLGIQSLALAYNGTAEPASFGLLSHPLQPSVPETGWVAISIRKLKIGEQDNFRAYAWLESAGPYRLVGKSIRLYFIPAGSPAPKAQ